MQIFEKDYCGDSLIDLEEDIHDAFNETLNPIISQIHTDEFGFFRGTFTVTINYKEDE